MGEVPDNELQRRQRLERLPRVTALYLRGRTVREIAAREDVTPRVIYKDIALACKTWLRTVRANAEAIVAKELARISEVERAAWQQYERSLQPLEERSNTRTTGGEAGTIRTRRKVTKQSLGDTRALDIVLKCCMMRCKLLKVDGSSDELEEAGLLQAKIVEIVVDTPEQVAKIITYAEYEEGLNAAAENEAPLV